jgi:ABC-type lipoprotein release transport system permease subunit
MATAGFVLSIIGTIYGALVTVFVIIYIIFSVWMIGYAAFFDSYDSWMRLLVFL